MARATKAGIVASFALMILVGPPWTPSWISSWSAPEIQEDGDGWVDETVPPPAVGADSGAAPCPVP